MIIKVKGNSDIHINNFTEFILFIKSIILNLKDDYIPIELKKYYYDNEYNNINGIKNFKKTIKQFFYNNTILNNNYWISRGWNMNESNEKIKEEQSKRGKAYQLQLKEVKKVDLYKWKSKYNTNIEYFLEKGYSNEESIKLLSERQTTFSKEKCILKYGKVEGTKIWRERQEKWKKSFNKSFTDTSLNDSCSIKFFKNKNNENWIIDYIDRNYMVNKKLIKDAIINSICIDTFCEYIYSNKNVFSMSELYPIYTSNVLSEYFNIEKSILKDKILSKYGMIPGKYGNIRWFNNHICRSNGEYYIARKLIENNIDYIYEYKYPNSNKISDFYIPKLDLYVEYMGFVKSEYMKEHNYNICMEYLKRYEFKRKMCIDNNLNYLFDTDQKLIIDKIISLYYN